MENLFDNEEIRYGCGYPSLVRFFEGSGSKPLVVFTPGWAHLGRITYGFPGSDEKNFLAYWITKKGYPFLVVSYPIDHPVYDTVHPEFNLTDWGNMTAEIASVYISEYGLGNEIIGISWSASGQVIRPFNVACGSLGLEVLFHLGIEATPAITVPADRTVGMKKTGKNMISLEDSHYRLFWNEIEEENRLNGEEIISEDDYMKYFVGDIPVGLMGTYERFEDGKFKIDAEKSTEDKGFFNFSEYPLVAVIHGDSALAPYHPIVNRSTWAFLVTRKIYHDYFVKRQAEGFRISKNKLNEFVRYVRTLPDRLSENVSGNHFLFVGRKGARRFSDLLEKFDREIAEIKGEISNILS
jgi:hypothetical protein